MISSIDDTDMKVLDALKENGRDSVRDIAKKKINMPITTVHNRLKKLRKEVIKKFTIVPDYEKLGKSVLALVFAGIDHEKLVESKEGLENLKKKLRGFPEIEQIAVTGEIDLILFTRVKNIKELDEFLIKKLRNIKGIQKTTTQIVLEED